MGAIISAFLAMIQGVLPLLGTVGATASTLTTIANIVGALTSLLPVLTKEYQDLVPIVRNIVSALKENSATTAEQLDQLQAMEQTLDANFEAAATAAQSEDTAGSNS